MKTLARLALSLLAFSWVGTACGTDMEEGPGLRLEDSVADADYPEVDTAAQGLGNGCRVTLGVFNERFEYEGTRRNLRIRKLSYWEPLSGMYRFEDVPNRVVDSNQVLIYGSRTLEHTENRRITSWRVHLNFEEDDGSWSPNGVVVVDTPDIICGDGDTIIIHIDGVYH